MAASILNTDLLTASLGKPVALAYGRHVVAGNVILRDESEAGRVIAFVALGEGEWDGIEELYVNGAPLDITGVEGFHFHRGRTGELSEKGGLEPEGTGAIYPFVADGDQKADALTPPGVQGLTFSRTAYLALSRPFDVFAPGPELDVRGIYRTRRVRLFDSTGVETDYRYSENPAWQIADLLTRVRGLSDSRIDWPSFSAAASYCDATILVNGQNVARFVSNVAFPEEVDFDQALNTLLGTCRGHLMDSGGVIRLRIDQERTSSFDFDMNQIAENSFQAFYRDTRETANRIELVIRDTDNNFAVMTKLWNHEVQQARTGRVISARVHLGNLPQHQAERIGNYLLTRSIDNNLFCRLRSTAASLAVMPGDVVRVAHDAAPWSQGVAGDARFQAFEVVEASEHPDDTREFLCRIYNPATYSDAAGPTQNLIGTVVRGRPLPPPDPTAWDVAADADGNLRLEFTIPRNADYRVGDLALLVDDDNDHLETTLTAAMGVSDSTVTSATSAGFMVGDFIRIGSEILEIAGPGIRGAVPTSTTWNVGRARKLTLAEAEASGGVIVRLKMRHLHFVLAAGFTLAHAGESSVVNLQPGQVRPYFASLVFTGLGGTSVAVEQAFDLDAPNVIAPQATEDGVIVDGQLRSRVTVSWTNPSDDRYAGVNVYTMGYLGTSGWQFFESAPHPATGFTRIFEKTGETIKFLFVSVNRLGAETRLATSPGWDETITVALDGADSAPAAVSGLTAAQTGDQALLTWNANSEADMRGYHIARRATAAAAQGDILDSDIVDAIPHVKAPGQKMAWMDAPGSATAPTQYYYVRAVDMGFFQGLWSPNPPAQLPITPETVAPVTSPSATEGPAIGRDGHVVSRVTIGFTKPVPIGQWRELEIYAVGYQASTEPLLVGQGEDSPFNFDLESTNETVTLRFVSVTRTGLRGDIDTSPSAVVLLDGQASAPLAPSGFSGQALVTRGQVVRLTWSENTEADISHYEVARRTDATAPGDADVVASVAAGGESATKKAQWDDAPGSATSQHRYYVRAVNTTNLKSAFSGPATITTLAPDGTTDTGVPSGGRPPSFTEFSILLPGAYPINAQSVPGAIVLTYVPGGLAAASWNMFGAFSVRFTVRTNDTFGGTGDDQTRVFEFPFDVNKAQRYVLFWPNRFLRKFSSEIKNYFGWSSVDTWFDLATATGGGFLSEMLEASPPSGSFDPAVQDYGARQVVGRSTGDLTITTNSASAKVTSPRPINTDTGYRVSSAAASGQFIRGNGTNGVFAAIAAGDLPAHNHAAADINSGVIDALRLPEASTSAEGTVTTGAQTFAGFKKSNDGFGLRIFNQAGRPTLNSGEVAIWRDNDASPSSRNGVLWFDGVNYFYLYGFEGDGTTAFAINP